MDEPYVWMEALLAAVLCPDSTIPVVTCVWLDGVHSFPFFLGSEHLFTHNCNRGKGDSGLSGPTIADSSPVCLPQALKLSYPSTHIVARVSF
jgi:hypothetical protein